jgi:tetratricopeptide (TPR) repeat protein
MDEGHAKASALAWKALELWEAGMLAEAETKYREAIRLAEEFESWLLPDHYSQLAQVLSCTGRSKEAVEYHERAMSEALGQGSDDDSSVTSILRYFFAEHLMAIERPARAMEILAPSLKGSPHCKNLLLMVEAEALARLGRKKDARRAAEEAVELSINEDQKARIRQRLAPTLEDAGTDT